jgi:hypothetical protein
MSKCKRCNSEECQTKDLPEILSKMLDMAEIDEDVEVFQQEYLRSFSRELGNMHVPECIAILGRELYSLGEKQRVLSDKLCNLFPDPSEVEKDLSEEQRERLMQVASEIIKTYLRIEVLGRLVSGASRKSADVLTAHHAASGVKLNLDVDPEEN